MDPDKAKVVRWIFERYPIQIYKTTAPKIYKTSAPIRTGRRDFLIRMVRKNYLLRIVWRYRYKYVLFWARMQNTSYRRIGGKILKSVKM